MYVDRNNSKAHLDAFPNSVSQVRPLTNSSNPLKNDPLTEMDEST